MTWQPIATAPKDGSVVLVWLGDADESERSFYCIDRTRMGAGGWNFMRGKWRPETGLTFTVFVQPTHWMPLPSPPEAS